MLTVIEDASVSDVIDSEQAIYPRLEEAFDEETRFLTPRNLSRLLYLRVLAAICSKSLIITFVLRI